MSARELPGLRVTGASLLLLRDFPAVRIKTRAAPDCASQSSLFADSAEEVK
jgi:hypothetical protein